MNSLYITLLTVIAYLSSSALLVLDVRHEALHKQSLLPAWLATLLHFCTLSIPFWQTQHFNFSFFNIASFIAAFVSGLLLIASTRKPVEKLGIVLFPLAAFALLANQLLPQTEQAVHHYTNAMYLHILSSIIAFSLLTIAALQAILLVIQEEQLRNHPPKRLIRHLPPLQTMESLLFQMIGIGVAFLSISLISGFIFIEDLFAQHLVHKTILSILAWIIFSGLLYGRLRFGWRGKTAAKWTLAGFILLLLAYFGSKFVLELLLHKH